jgi:hypothetical protein
MAYFLGSFFDFAAKRRVGVFSDEDSAGAAPAGPLITLVLKLDCFAEP